MTEQKKQHYVPQFYLRNFALKPAVKAVSLFRLPKGPFVAVAPIRTQAYEDNFYMSQEFEAALGSVESTAAEIIGAIVERGVIPARYSAEHFWLSLFVVIQRFRTQYAAAEVNEMADKLAKNLLQHEEKLKGHLDEIRIGVQNAPTLAASLATLVHAMIWDLRYKVLENCTQQPFITSDHPVTFYNQFLENRVRAVTITGVTSKGLEMFMPLSPRYLIVFYDADVYRVGGKRLAPGVVRLRGEADVLALNVMQAANAEQCIYFNDTLRVSSRSEIVRLANKCRLDEKTMLQEFKGGTDADGRKGSLVIQGRIDLRIGLKLTFISLNKMAAQYNFGGRLVHLRNPHLYAVYRQFCKEVLAGKFLPLDFQKYLQERHPEIWNAGKHADRTAPQKCIYPSNQ